jgi:membrane associated rhomboid family serine protease
MPYQEDNGPPMFTYAMLAVFIAFFGAQYTQADLAHFYAFPWRVAHGELWRLLTCTFLHGSVMHVLFNVALFLRFAPVVDNWLGPWGALALYLVAGSSASAAQILVGAGPLGLVGASGVVYGFFGFLWVMSRRRDDAALAANPHIVQTMFGWLVICAVVNFFGGYIANTAHVWGLLIGWLIGQTFVARKKWRWPLVAATVAAWVLPIVLCQHAVWSRTFGRIERLQRVSWIGYPREYWEHPEGIERHANEIRPGLVGTDRAESGESE